MLPSPVVILVGPCLDWGHSKLFEGFLSNGESRSRWLNL